MATFKYTFEVVLDADNYEDSEQEARVIQEMLQCGTNSSIIHVGVIFEDGGDY